MTQNQTTRHSVGNVASSVVGVSSRNQLNANKENKPINQSVGIGHLQALNKTLSVLEGRRTHKNVAQQKIAQAAAFHRDGSFAEAVNSASASTRAAASYGKSIREPNTSATASGVGMFAKEYTTSLNSKKGVSKDKTTTPAAHVIRGTSSKNFDHAFVRKKAS